MAGLQSPVLVADLEESWRSASAELTRAVRAVTRAAALSTAEESVLVDAAAQLDVLTRRLSATPRDSVLVGDFGRRPDDTDGTRRIGDHNAQVIPLTIVAEGDSAFATWIADEVHEGSGGLLHGGTAAWLMDCMCGLLLEEMGTVGRTANLTLDYRAPTPLATELHLRSTIEKRDGRKIWVAGDIRVAGEVTVTARGLFILPRDA
ncbi:PaaI family thioesterase [Gordonia sp. i37]|uniref:PaaI family thioesterase n=1 Tax=Gordonia sp. i37 TaxID=1961707 RepID=UPI0009ADA8B8|nr:PaaI family thioesterase [Gordonia sp. i37]OPX05628.1 hypothetical protein B1964_29330 [Gordonia sp. i37]